MKANLQKFLLTNLNVMAEHKIIIAPEFLFKLNLGDVPGLDL
jgi:hypothetical protein